MNGSKDSQANVHNMSGEKPDDILPETVGGNQAPAQNSGPEEHVVRTRASRVVKAVNRLIENMVQKPLPRGIVNGFSKKSQSLLTLF